MSEKTQAKLVIILTTTILLSSMGLGLLYTENQKLKDQVFELDFKKDYAEWQLGEYVETIYELADETGYRIYWVEGGLNEPAELTYEIRTPIDFDGENDYVIIEE